MRGATVGDQVRPQSELISIHAPLAGCDIDDLIPYANNAKFQSTHPSRGATRAIWIPHSWRKYFNPRAPCGARQRQHDALLRQPLISIHAPRAGRDWSSGDKGCRHGISIHAPRAGRDILIEVDGKTVVISIHAPHAGRDRKSYPCRMGGSTYFNPRAPCGARPLVPGIYQLLKNHFNPRTPCGARRQIHQDHRLTMEFQSTRPMRGATNSSFQRYFFCHYFNPRAPCGARRRNCNSMGQVHKISIHAPHAGRNCQAAHREPYCTNFNPRAPCGARLDVLFLHALTRCDFNPRTPCGARRFRYVTVAFVWSFQSTRPMRGATFYILPTMRARDISIHAPHAGRDAGDKYITGSNCISIHAPLAGCDVEHIQHTVWFSPYFNPRAPCGARQGDHLGGTPLRAISIHAPHAGATRASAARLFFHLYFNPRAPCGRDLFTTVFPLVTMYFNPRAPCGRDVES